MNLSGEACAAAVRAVARLCVCLACLAMAACAATVYKTSASTFVQEGAKAKASINAVSQRVVEADKAYKEDLIVHDSTCPMGFFIMLRNNGTGHRVGDALARFPEHRDLCQGALKCEGPGGGTSAECQGACFTETQAQCLQAINDSYVKAGSAVPSSEANRFSAMVRNNDYDAVGMNASNALGAKAVVALAGYLDVLDAAAKGKPVDASADAKVVLGYADDVRSAADALKIKTDGLPDETKVSGTVNALVSLVDFLRNVAAAEGDAEVIKQQVKDHHVEIGQLIDQLRKLTLADATQAATRADQLAISRRMHIANDANGPHTVAARQALLDQRNATSYADLAEAKANVDGVFNALAAANDDLSSLVLDPTSSQKKALADARFENFKAWVAALGGVVAMFM
jgi:hypothetical protein